MTELDKSYDASKYEADIYKLWMDSGYFNPDNLPALDDGAEREPFTIVLPPPNVTGTLHLGHAFEDTIQDILIRFRRMQGRKALWLPGTDHAAIATQNKVEKILEKEGTRKTDLSREDFLGRVEQFAQESHDTIVGQLKAMGASVDWSREAYTLDETRSLAVRTAFKAMFDDGLIYRGHKVINWDPKGQTVISDEEIVHQERDSILYTFKYSADFPIAISTTRPETKVGDTAVAVHPDDNRYAKFVGQEYDVEFAGVPLHIKVIADENVEKEFGTGALGVTPAHSLIDAEIAERHSLPIKPVINEFAKMTVGPNKAGLELDGKKVIEAREIIVSWLKSQNLITAEEPIKQNMATAERSGGTIEPLPKLQWFLAVNKPFSIKNSQIDGIKTGQEITLKQLMRHVIEQKQIAIIPEHFSKTYFNWIDNLRDWCISRQLWFGHRIPVWYKGSAVSPTEIYCGVTAPEGEGWQQDEDTLDTWFSAGLWTFATMGWPAETSDLKTFHPTSVIAPGYEILFFWVARMILMTGYHLGTIPFQQIYLHGIVRDKDGKKFSKSQGNGIDPIEMAGKYGTDALRFALVFNAAPGNDTLFDEQKVKGMKHFGNKVWNITRFVLQNINNTAAHTSDTQTDSTPKAITPADTLVLNQLEQSELTITTALENFQIHIAAQALYDFVWRDFADVYIEASKSQLLTADQKENTQTILLHVLTKCLILLHPFMPFVTEVLWQQLKLAQLVQTDLLMVEQWPQNRLS